MPIVPAPIVTAGCGCIVCSHPCGNECVMHLDIVHVARPDQQRVGRIGRALVAVAAALDRQAQVIFAGKIHRRGNVLRIPRRDRVNAGLGGPRIDPSQGLREPGLVADVIWILQILRVSVAAAAAGSDAESGKFTGIKFPPTASLSCFHADCDGHAASEGRRRLKFVAAAHNRRGKIGMSAADPIAFRNALLFIRPSSECTPAQLW